MANTIIQIKRSSITTQPASLQAAEPAYSYLSDKLFIGDASGAVIEIGGRYYINVAQKSWDTANAAFIHANAAFAYANTISSDADEKANAAIITANASFDAANAAFLAANTGTSAGFAFNAANAAFGTANIAIANVNYVNTATQAAFAQANSADATAVAAYVHANAAHLHANSGFVQANTAYTVGNAAFDKANTAETIAIAAYQNSNTKLATTGGTITGDLAVTGNLVISGNTTYVNVNDLQVSDPLIYLAGNNYLADIVDIGFIANYVNATGANVHTGLYREHENKMYYLFQGYDREPANNHLGAFSNNMTLAVLNADLITSNLTLAGINALTRIATVFDKANTGDITGSAAFDKANSANLLAFNTGVGANAYASAVGVAANTYAASYADAVGVSANLYAAQVGTSANAYASAVGVSANLYAAQVGTSANAYASAVGVAANTYADGVGAAANTNAANASYLSTGTVPSARISGSYTGITGVGTLSVGTWQADTINVAYGGTGITSVANNGLLFGRGGAGALRVVSSSTEGHVLQTNEFGTPTFGMLDGGSF